MKKALHRKIKYLGNLKTELHNKTIKYLTDNYAKIIVPPFEIQNMARKFNSKISRMLYNISFCTFKEKLKYKCTEKDIELIIRPEYYTSKTCTRCGNIKKNLGSAEVYECEKCGLIIGRDIGAARNIILRNHRFD
jgi:putative transposase